MNEFEAVAGVPEESPARGRTNLRLSPQARDALEEIMRIGGFSTLAEAARRAIGDELFLLRERKNGWDVILRKDDRYREVTWTV
jgi:hypothetical protein